MSWVRDSCALTQEEKDLMRIPGRTAAVALAVTMTVGTGAQAALATSAPANLPKSLPTTKLNVVAAKTSVAKRTTANLRLRAKATTNSATLAVIPKGTKLTVLATSGNWSKVKYAGKTGWSSNSYLDTATASKDSATGTPRFTTANLNLRTGGGTNYRSIGVIPKGERVTVLQTSRGWAKVSSSQGTGWASESYLKATAGSTTPQKQTPETSTSTGYTAANLNLRTGAGISYRSVGVIPQGEKVTIYRSSGNWAQVSSSKGTGWVSKSYLSGAASQQSPTPKPEQTQTTETAYATVAVNQRSGAGTSYRVLGVVQAGEKVSVLSESAGWSKVTSSVGTGYIASSYLSSSATEKAPSTTQSVRSDTKLVMQAVARLFAGDYTSFGTIRSGSVGHSSGRAVDVMISNYKSASGVKAGDRIAQFLLDNRAQLGVSYLIWQDKIWLGESKGWEPYSTSGKYGTQFTNNWTDNTRHMNHVHVETFGESATGGALDYSALNN